MSKVVNRDRIALLLSLNFFFILLLYVVYSMIFTKSRIKNSSINAYDNPIRQDIIANLNTIKIKNRVSSFTVTQDILDKWKMVLPRKFPVKSDVITSIKNVLLNIQVKNIHQYEPINLASFSLNTPLTTLSLFTKLDDKLTVHFGIINPINSSTYIAIEGEKKIYEIKTPTFQMDSLNISDFIESRVFPYDLNELSSLSIKYHQSSPLVFKISESMEISTNKYKKINQSQSRKFLTQLLATKVDIILDSQDEELKTALINYKKRLSYQLQTSLRNQKNVVNISLSFPIKSLPSMKIEKNKNIIVWIDNRQYPFLVNKEIIDKLKINYSDLR